MTRPPHSTELALKTTYFSHRTHSSVDVALTNYISDCP
jgi:hypothetical protein